MAVQTDPQPVTETRVKRNTLQRPRRFLWPLALLIALGIASATGVAVVANLTGPTANTGTAHQEPNANTREGRAPCPPSTGPGRSILGADPAPGTAGKRP